MRRKRPVWWLQLLQFVIGMAIIAWGGYLNNGIGFILVLIGAVVAFWEFAIAIMFE